MADPTVPYDENSKALIRTTPAPASAKWWADKVGCSVQTHEAQEEGRIQIDRYSGGRNGVEVELISIKDGGHMWPTALSLAGPGSAANVPATDLIWDFFKSHPKS
jgi:polyhydroxybutyrate depolymerase